MKLPLLSLLGLVLTLSSRPAVAQTTCPAIVSARKAIDRGWTAYRANDITSAGNEFKAAVKLCPSDPGALTGAGYAAMREGQLTAARSYFARAIAADSASYDAAAGAGMAAYRAGDQKAAHKSFDRALRIVPGDSTAIAYLARLTSQTTAAVMTQRERPVVTSIVARTARRVIQVRDAKGKWVPMWIKAVNLGAALPGKFPSEFPPNDSTYERWIAITAQMGANAVRVYTIHPPHFYAALRNWNLSHPTKPLWLIHGVWTEPPPGKKQEKYDDPQWLAQFRREMQHVVALVHGDVVIPPLPGHAGGSYTADVSQWTLGYIIGREWEPYSVVAYNTLQPRRTSYAGKYITVAGANALEISLLKARGEKIVEMPKEYDNDAVGLDAAKMRATAAFPAGVFSSYHAYPYYPEFMVVDPGYLKARSPEGPSNYFGYLRELVEHHGEMPVVISEYGVPSARGNAHVQPQGWNHGGLSEQEQATTDARLTRDIYASGAAGAGLFSLIDEWFKKNWSVIEFEYT